MSETGMSVREIMTLNQCECRARTILVWYDSAGYHCDCYSCRGKEQIAPTKEEAIDNWRNARDMKIIDSFYKE
jgi:hypothetical protein